MQKAQTSLKPPEALAEILKKFNLDHPGEPTSEPSEQKISTKHSEPTTVVPLETNMIPSIEPDDDDDNDDYFISKPINSAFEINIAEFPIAYLNRGQLPDGVSKTKYQYKDEIKGRNGEPVERVWTIEAHATEEVLQHLTLSMNSSSCGKNKDSKSRKFILELFTTYSRD
jgi:hypothetical protein